METKPPIDPNPRWCDRDYLVAIYLQNQQILQALKVTSIDVTPSDPTNREVS